MLNSLDDALSEAISRTIDGHCDDAIDEVTNSLDDALAEVVSRTIGGHHGGAIEEGATPLVFIPRVPKCSTDTMASVTAPAKMQAATAPESETKAAPVPRSADIRILLAFMKPLESLLLNDSITEVIGNQDGSWFYEERGKQGWQRADIVFNHEDLQTALTVVASTLNKPFGKAYPILNAQLADGSRISATLPPVTRPGPSVTIRKFPSQRYTIHNLVEFGMIPPDLYEKFSDLIAGRLDGGHSGGTFLISGATSSGKTTLLNALTDLIPQTERLVVIEDTRELQLDHPNMTLFECQNYSFQTDKETITVTVSFDDLLKLTLRYTPDRIVLGEVRGVEASTLLDSFNTGHGGSIATIHASSAARALTRLAKLAMRAHQQAVKDDLCQEVAECVNYVISAAMTKEGRKVTELIQVTGYDSNSGAFQYKSLYKYQPAASTPTR